MNEPKCVVYTSGAVVLLVSTDLGADPLQALEQQLAASVGASSASALVRRVSSSVLRLNAAAAEPAVAHARNNNAASAALDMAAAAQSHSAGAAERAAAGEGAVEAAGAGDGSDVSTDDVQAWADAESGGTPAEPAEEAEGTGTVVPERRDSVVSADSADSVTSEQAVHVEL